MRKEDFLIKTIIVLSLLIFLTSFANARTLDGETDVNVFLDIGNTGWSHNVQQGKWFFIKTRIIDVNNNAIRNHHIGLKIEDSRGAIINDYTEEVRNICDNEKCSRESFFIVSDDNGFIDYAFQILPCTPIQNQFCFHPDQNYTFRIIQKNLDYEGQFNVRIFKGDIDFLGNLMRTVIVNFRYIYILLFSFILLIVVGTTIILIFKRKRSRR